ncbi:acetyl-CoA synthetase [Sulfitobacter marinus]|uniref:Acetyl-CoA synthetase n=1 Tax=Sulfitobacter marinus TaxID=394264 RepID=A0A1I6V2N1_9RHOB|nr:acetate--CoA ligase family protein [Sulfitobacter marinus]SFT07931.1 acetyl-CoA synthetase [Sulfitobacter marinus]
MRRNLDRLLRPKSIVLIGGGAWGAQVIRQSQKMGFQGALYVVHPKGVSIEGINAFRSLDELPEVPDAAFIGVNRRATVDVVAQLSAMEAGGAVCFASGFSEAEAEDNTASALQTQLVTAAGTMPILGPNCYGLINALDGALLWPDQHGCTPVDRGVAILTQSSNIAINLTMQQRGLPIAYMVTCGNMAQTTQAEIALALLDDPRLTAIGLHIEGFSDTSAWHRLAIAAAAKNIPLVALKVGVSDQAQQAAVSHTASLAGGDAAAGALLRRLGIARLRDLPSFLETLKVLHVNGHLNGALLSSISCSGGEASLTADTAHGAEVSFPALTEGQMLALRDTLGPMVALSNPLDYNTYIWRDVEKMTTAWLPMAADHIGLTLVIVDYPHTDADDWECATQAALNLRERSGRPVAVVATLPELMPTNVMERLIAGGVTPICGLSEAIAAGEAAAFDVPPDPVPPLQPGADRDAQLISEGAAKQMLAEFGLRVPKGHVANTPAEAGAIAIKIGGLVVLKGQGLAHKSEAGAVVVGIASDAVEACANDMPTDSFLVEEMVQNPVAELLIGVTRDPVHGFLLTIGAGGVLTELWQDTVSMLLPVTPAQIQDALQKLRITPLLNGYRGKPGADLGAITKAIMSVQAYVIAHQDAISEVEVNPLICGTGSAIAVDALIRRS